MKIACFCGIAVLSIAGSAFAQPVARIVGDRIGGNMQIDAKAGTVVDTATLTFDGRGGGPVYTIDFIARHPIDRPVATDAVIDIVVAEQPVEDESPEMTLRADDEPVPVIARLHSRRSVVASVPLSQIDRLASAGVVVDRTFGTELELGRGQVRMLRATVDRWLGRVR